MSGIQIVRYRMTFPELTRKLMVEDKLTYDQSVILIRLNELQDRGSRAVKICKATAKGTAFTFSPIDSAEEYAMELENIVSEGEKCGLQFQKEQGKMGGLYDSSRNESI